jgi:hypothetical protein
LSRIAVTLDEHAHAELARRAEAAKEPVARAAARLIRDGLLSTTETQAGGEPAPAAPAKTETTGLPGWLEPSGERERWRRELWATVCALAERYPRVFSKLVADWWTDRALIEVLGALGAWRAQLDSGISIDPRAELLFHDRLELLERHLTKDSDPTAARFTGGAPPAEWVA